MRKKISFIALIVAITLGGSVFTACNNQKTDNKPTTVQNTGNNGIKIAFVRLDSLYSKYQYYKDINEQLNKEAQASQKALASKLNAFGKAAEDFQRRVRTNAFVSQESAQMEQQKLANMQQEGQQFEAKLQQEMMNKNMAAMDKFQKKLQEEINKYNKDKGFTFILTDLNHQNLLYADSAYDITDELATFLNKEYSKEKDK
ncbi:OmpH family outer membrane protein [Falsiporphyromonas endometrii]|uniref:OmpH family outer membrane protein n=1 Tax=Falsiporphyromonas endometrii TaxID=1387297 RepID=A0ABV9K768_9PORP